MITVIKKGKTPVYEVECYECGSVLHYTRADVSLMHIHCPFCGGEASIIKYMDGTYCVECENDNCNIIAMTVLADTEARAIEVWNNRTSHWHTGTPTEDGWYLVQHLSDAEYCGSKFFVARWDGEKFIINPRLPIIVTYSQGTAWQKIEPYKEKK